MPKGAKLITTMKDQLAYRHQRRVHSGIDRRRGPDPSVIKLKIPYTFQSGEVSLSLQENLDKIMPFLPQVILVLICYRLSKVKGMTAGKLIFIVMIRRDCFIRAEGGRLMERNRYFETIEDLFRRLEITQKENIHQAAGINRAFHHGRRNSAVLWQRPFPMPPRSKSPDGQAVYLPRR